MKYRNLRTGNVINVKSGFSSKEWVPVMAPAPEKTKVAPVQQPRKGSRKKKAVEEFDDEED